MIDSYLITINDASDFKKLKEKIKNTHIDDETVAELQYHFYGVCDALRIESPYSDKDYLSTYYIHYSKKYKNIDKKCYRIHLFSQGCYCGFITLRPTCHRKIGRSYIDPTILLDYRTDVKNVAVDSFLMATEFKVNILGNTNVVSAFPWMHQEPDVACCAHVALWSILRYFGTSHANYADATMAEIVDKIQYNYDRKIPTKGLREEQISNLLLQYGFSTLIRSNHVNDEIFTYIESGLPIIGIIPSDNDEAHAICLIGHGPVNRDIDIMGIHEKYTIKRKGSTKQKEITTDIILSTKFLDSLIVNDDNYLPYRTVYRKLCSLEKAQKYDPKYIVDDIRSFIIPLYEKMQITYNEVYNIVMNLLVSKKLNNLPTPKILRFFITSSNAFKRSLKERGVETELRRILLRVNMPKFIWCAEIASYENYKKGLVDGCVVIDATESSEEDAPFLAMHDNAQVFYYNGSRLLQNEFEIPPYKLYINNLKAFKRL